MFTKLNLTALLLVFLLAACAPAPQYGPVVTPESPVPSATATFAPMQEAAPTAVDDKPSRDAKQEAVSLYETVFTFRDFDGVAQDLCAVATEYGCWLFLALQDEYESVSTKWPGEKPSNIESTLLHEGRMSDGSEYQAWMVEADQVWTTNKVYWYPVFVWQDGAWLFFAPPTYRASMSLEVCGQILRYGEDGQHANQWDAETWDKNYSDCQAATPLPPTPFAPLTPVFTPQP